MDRSQRLGEGNIPRLLFAFSLPSIVGMLAQATYAVVDRVFIGWALGSPGIAGVTVTFPLMLIFMAFGMLVGLGSAALVSIRLGEKNHAEAEQVLAHALVLLLVVSLALTVVGLVLLEPLLRLFGASEAVLPYARDYARIIVLGSVFQLLGWLNAVIRGEGNPRIAMVTMLLGALLNAMLAPLFIFGFGWGMSGVATATVLSQAASAAWVLSYFFGGRSLLRLHLKHLRLRWSVCRVILAIGSPPFALQLAASVQNAILNNQLRIYGGDVAISAMGIIWALVMFLIMPIFGLNQGSQPIIGYNYGALKFDRVKKTLQTAILAATTISSLGFAVVMIWPTEVIGVFHQDDPALLAMGTHAIRIALMMLPIVGFQIVGANYFQAVGKPKQAMLLSLSRQVLLLIPTVLILPRFFGLDGLLAAMPVSDLCSALLTGTWLLWELRHLRRSHALQAADAVAPVLSVD